jgi:hypothetical protein
MGAVQIYELKSGGSWKRCGAASPEVLEASTEFGGAEGEMMEFARETVQCMPARLRRVPIRTLQPASTTPVEVHKPCAWNLE